MWFIIYYMCVVCGNDVCYNCVVCGLWRVPGIVYMVCLWCVFGICVFGLNVFLLSVRYLHDWPQALTYDELCVCVCTRVYVMWRYRK